MRNLNKFKDLVKDEFKPVLDCLNEKYLTVFNTWASRKSGLPVDVEIDNGFICESLNLPLTLFFRNSYLPDKEEWLGVSVEKPYIPLFELQGLNITLGDYYKVCSFVDRHKKELALMAEEKLGYFEFIENKALESRQLLNEMANLPSEVTGLKQQMLILFGLLGGDVKVYKRNTPKGKFYITPDNKESLFKSKDGQPLYFDDISIPNIGGKYCTGTIGETDYIIYANGTLKEI